MRGACDQPSGPPLTDRGSFAEPPLRKVQPVGVQRLGQGLVGADQEGQIVLAAGLRKAAAGLQTVRATERAENNARARGQARGLAPRLRRPVRLGQEQQGRQGPEPGVGLGVRPA